MTNLALRLEDLPGVASVSVDLDDTVNGGINVRLEPGADEKEVMERVRALLVAYGVRPASSARVKVGRAAMSTSEGSPGVEVRVTPIKGGARIEVMGRKVRSFRIAPPNPSAIVQGVADAWCQVVGKIPVEIVGVSIGDRGELTVVASNGTSESVGRANVGEGWQKAITTAVGEALRLTGGTGGSRDAELTSPAW